MAERPHPDLLPNSDGKRLFADLSIIEQSVLDSYEHDFSCPLDILTINLHPTVIVAAFDSDDRVERYCRPFALGYHPAGSNCYVRRERPGRHFYSVSLPPSVRNAVMDEFGVSLSKVRTLFQVSSPKITAVANELASLYRDDDPKTALEMDLVALALLAEAVKKLADHNARAGRPPTPSATRSLMRAMAFIEDNLDQDLSLEAIAAEAGMSVYHFSRSFKLANGVGPWAFTVARRIDRARDLLANTDRPISAIAADCGFATQSHFSSVFKRHVGAPPGVYRRTLLE